MALSFNVRNANEAYLTLVNKLQDEGVLLEVKRGDKVFKTQELLNVSITLTEPLERLITIPGFEQQPYWLASECITELLGLNPSLSYEVTRAKVAKEILEEMNRPNGMHQYTYGQRFAQYHVLEKVLNRLKEDNSRQAIFTIYNNQDLYEWSIPCTILHQYFKRDGKLHLTVYYRSNDIYRGFRNDVYFSSVMLELMSAWSNSEIGTLTMVFGSLHSYDYDWDKLKALNYRMLPLAKSLLPYEPLKASEKDLYTSLRIIYRSILRNDRYPTKTNIQLLDKWREAIWLYNNNLPAPTEFY